MSEIRDSLTVGVVPILHSAARWKGSFKSEKTLKRADILDQFWETACPSGSLKFLEVKVSGENARLALTPKTHQF